MAELSAHGYFYPATGVGFLKTISHEFVALAGATEASPETLLPQNCLPDRDIHSSHARLPGIVHSA